MKKLNFAIIGVGNIAGIHAAAIRGTPDAELVAVATRNPERGKASVAEHGGTCYSDYREVLKQPDVDVIALCTPHDLHAPMTIEAAAAGKHVLCEKPMARTVAECDEMIAACELTGVTLGVVFQGRFEPLSKRLKADVEAGRLGIVQPAGGNGYELLAIGAVIIGGASTFGGEGSIVATLIGAIIVTTIRNGLNILGVNAFWQYVVNGLVIIGAVAVDQMRRRR